LITAANDHNNPDSVVISLAVGGEGKATFERLFRVEA
jgi:hypothetical protein